MTMKWEFDLTGLVGVIALGVAFWAVWVASKQLSAMLAQTRANTLLSLDEHYSSQPLLSIRQEVLSLMVQVRDTARMTWPGLSETERRERSRELFSSRFEVMRRDDRPQYNRLFEIVSFLETVGYLAKAGYIPVSDTINLFGLSIKQAGLVFGLWIQKLQQAEGSDPHEYEWFLWLVGQEQTKE